MIAGPPQTITSDRYVSPYTSTATTAEPLWRITNDTATGSGYYEVYWSGAIVSNTDYSYYYREPAPDPLYEAIEGFKKAVASRRALALAWSKEARAQLFRNALRLVFPEDQKLQRFCYGRERRSMPVRELFKKRVCGGHQRYRVMTP